MDEPGIQAAVGVAVGVVLGAAFTALAAGLEASGDVRFRALAEGGGRIGELARRVANGGAVIRRRLLAGRVACLATATALSITASASLPIGKPWAVVAVVVTYTAMAHFATAVAVRSSPDGILRVYRWFRPFEALLAPFVAPLALVDRLVARWMPHRREESPYAERITELAVESVIEQGEEEGSIAEEQAKLLWNVLEFKNTVAREVMVPRTQIIAFEIESDIEVVLARIIEHGHSRYPVFRGSNDHIEGILYAKDLFRAFREDQGLDSLRLADVVRAPAFFVSEGQKIGTVLAEMQSRRFHMAIVADEFGGISGLVTLEDIVEEIVGEIQDEHDVEEPMIRAIGDGRFEVQAGISVYDLEDFLGEPLHTTEGDFDSLGGLVVQLAGCVPVPGDSVRAGRFDLRVIEGDERRVSRVEIAPVDRCEGGAQLAS